MNISVIGASGNIGREIAISIIREKILEKTGNIQFVCRKDPVSERSLMGLSIDIADSYADNMPSIQVVNSPTDVNGDIVIMQGEHPYRKTKAQT